MSQKYQTIPCLLLCLVILTATTGCISEPASRGCLSHHSFDIIIDVNETITNATFYIPVPVKNGIPQVGPVELNKGQFEQKNFHADLVRAPPGLELHEAFTVAGSQPWFLRLSAEKIEPSQSGGPEYSVGIGNSTYSYSPDVFMNTLYPLGNESVILPKLDFSPPYHQEIASRSPEWIEYAPARTQQTTLVYADYSASPTTRVEIHSYLLGFNAWSDPLTPGVVNTGIDGGGNEYQDSYSWTGTGESHEWHLAEGMYGSTKGVYPNFSHARWKEIVAATAHGT
ncbi:MAG: hypothetical protein WCX22_03425 [Methanoregula sp.]